jgi:hypothetical protein
VDGGTILSMSTPIDDLLGPTPQDYGFPESPTFAQRDCWVRQEHFLEAFATCGKIGVAATTVGISRSCVERWQGQDLYGFLKRMEQAHRQYVESLEAEMDATIKSRLVATQVLQIFRLKAEAPENYREDVKVVGLDQSKLMLDKLREMTGRDIKDQASLEPPVEGIYKELDSPKPDGGQRAEDAHALAQAPQAPPTQPPSQMSSKESTRDRRAAQFRASRAARGRPGHRVIRR